MEEKKEEGEAEIHEHGPEHWFSKWERQCLAEAEREEPSEEEVDQNQEKLWHLFQNSATAVAQLYKGLSGAMASISVRSSTPGSPTHVSGSSNAGRRRNGLHDVDLNTFISEEMALHLGSAGTRKRTSVQCADVITDSPTHKRNRML
ncbi:hypothetical protein cypCar_00045170 [Cyprinus carpio]|nr:hypothetical protein cypCar_00045170 [Cyprinus carpio]